MEKLKNIFKKTDIYLVLFSLLAIRAIGFDFNFAQAILAISFMGFSGYKMWLENSKKPDNIGELRDEFNKLKQEVTRSNIKTVVSADASTKRYF